MVSKGSKVPVVSRGRKVTRVTAVKMVNLERQGNATVKFCTQLLVIATLTLLHVTPKLARYVKRVV